MILRTMTVEQLDARDAVRDKVEALRVATLAALREVADFALTHACLTDEGLDEFGCRANRPAEAAGNTLGVDYAFQALLRPIREWEPDHGPGHDLTPCPPGEYGA